MTLIKFKNENPVLSRTKSPYFSEFFNDLFENLPASDFRKSTLPGVNILENDEMYKLELAAPGLVKDDFKISIENDVLTVSTEKKSRRNREDRKIHPQGVFLFIISQELHTS